MLVTFSDFEMVRLNSGIFMVFEPSEWNLILNSPDCRVSKSIWKDIKLGPISWEPNMENSLSSVCVGVREMSIPGQTSVHDIGGLKLEC